MTVSLGPARSTLYVQHCHKVRVDGGNTQCRHITPRSKLRKKTWKIVLEITAVLSESSNMTESYPVFSLSVNTDGTGEQVYNWHRHLTCREPRATNIVAACSCSCSFDRIVLQLPPSARWLDLWLFPARTLTISGRDARAWATSHVTLVVEADVGGDPAPPGVGGEMCAHVRGCWACTCDSFSLSCNCCPDLAIRALQTRAAWREEGLQHHTLP